MNRDQKENLKALKDIKKELKKNKNLIQDLLISAKIITKKGNLTKHYK